MKTFKQLMSEAQNKDTIRKKIQAKQDALSLAKERRKAKNQHVQSDREIKLADEIRKLRDLLDSIN